jgi:pimeloyl-ACP methyl ester carboxylesterase
MNPYSYSNGNNSFHLSAKPSSKQPSYDVDFLSAYSLTYPENKQAYGEYYHPANGDKVPFVILLHGLGDQSIVPCRLLAGSLANHGIASFVLYLPFHSRRMTANQKSRYPTLTPKEWFEIYRMSVINVRQVTDWAEQRSDINKEKIGLFGISLGGFVAAITMGVDDRPRASILTVMGGNSSKISQRSQRYGARRGFNRSRQEYEKIQQNYFKYLQEVAERGFENVLPDENFFLTDPLTFSEVLRNKRLLMINASWDEVIPKDATKEFWKACNKPPIVWLPATHATIWAYYPLLRAKILKFLESCFQ